jgi:hypothetical protein
VGDQQLRRADLLDGVLPEVAQGEFGAGANQLGHARARQTGACIGGAGEQAAVLDEVQAVERGEATAPLSSKRCRCAPEDGQPLVERAALALLGVGDHLDHRTVVR